MLITIMNKLCMIQQLRCFLLKGYITGLAVLCSLFFSTTTLGQCAGEDATVIVCDKESDPNNENFNLFDQLLGNPQEGGVWTPDTPLNLNALNEVTGIVNLWEINSSGAHVFSYTNSSCNETATVTVFLGGYPGEDNVDGSATACSDDGHVDLFTFLDDELSSISPDLNGEWTEEQATRALNDEIFDAEVAGPGTYTFYYTTNVVETTDINNPVVVCEARTATVELTVYRAPFPGGDALIQICEKDDLSGYTAVDLSSHLVGEDIDGVWTESRFTSQITGAFDSTINIQEIYNNNGSGKYEFYYTVRPEHPICDTKVAKVTVSLPDITARFSVKNICAQSNENLDYRLVNPVLEDADFVYNVDYEIVNVNTNEVVFTGAENQVDISMDDINTPIENDIKIDDDAPPLSLPPGRYVIRALTVTRVSGAICDSFTIEDEEFLVFDSNISVSDSCYDGSSNVDVTISDVINLEGELANEEIKVDYILTDLTNQTQEIVEDYPLTFTNGTVVLPIDISGFPFEADNYSLEVYRANRDTSGLIIYGVDCLNVIDFQVRRPPTEDISLGFTLDNVCNTSDLSVVIDAPVLPNGKYDITYTVERIGAPDDEPPLINQVIETIGGLTTEQDVNITSLDAGEYIITLHSIQNDTTPCRTVFEFTQTQTFSVESIPDTPILEDQQLFCVNANSTLNDIIVTNGTNLTWYEDLTSTTPLDPTTVLEDGESYFVTASNSVGCESSDRSEVVVSIAEPLPVTTTDPNPVFCGANNPTLANLDVQTSSGELVWYDSLTGGNVLEDNTVLNNAITYYVVSSINGCESVPRLPINVTVVSPPNSGVPTNITVCTTENLSGYSAINLFDYLEGEALNGVWTDSSTTITNQISDPSDAIINIEEIYNNFGNGDYSFTYTVATDNTICPDQSTTIQVLLTGEDVTARFLVENQCVSQPLVIPIEDTSAGVTYDLEYEIEDTSTNTIVYTNVATGIGTPDINGELQTFFELPANTLTTGNYVIRSLSISNLEGILCSSFVITEGEFSIWDANISAADICHDIDNVTIDITGFYGEDGVLINGDHLINYELNDLKNNQSATNSSIVSFTNGVGVLPITIPDLPIAVNEYSVTVSKTESSALDCTTPLMIRHVPEDINIDIAIDNDCDATQMSLNIDAPELADGAYVLSYEIRDVNSLQLMQSYVRPPFNGGQLVYQVDITGLASGDYIIEGGTVQDDTTLCRTNFEVNFSQNFSIGKIVEVPQLEDKQTFCLLDYQPNSPTLADIVILSGENLTWYDDLTSTTPLAPTTVLVDGEDYYVSATGDGCENSNRSVVVTTVLSPELITTSQTQQLFCITSAPTIADLEVEGVDLQSLIWYDSLQGGNVLTVDTPLVDGVSYYAVRSADGCEGVTRLAFTPVVVTPPSSGGAINLVVCATEDLSAFSAIDLFDYLVDEDSNGVWSDSSNTNTGQISNGSDSIINIEDIYNTLGEGDYNFTYTVASGTALCSDQSTTVLVSVTGTGVTGALSVESQCVSAPVVIEIDSESDGGSYDLEYEIEDKSTNNIVYTSVAEGIGTPDMNGERQTSFELPANTLAVGQYVIRSLSISNTVGLLCDTFIISEDEFNITDAKISIEDTCHDIDDIMIDITDFYGEDGTLLNGDYLINYELNDLENNQSASDSSTVTFTNGVGVLPITIPALAIAVNEYSVTVTTTEPSALNCTAPLMIRHVPQEISFDVSIDNNCNATQMSLNIDAPQLADGEYVLSYEIRDANSLELKQSFVRAPFSGGQLFYQIDLVGLGEGDYIIQGGTVQDDTTLCRTNFEVNFSQNFSIGKVVEVPQLEDKQTFCLANYQSNLPTLEDIIVQSGENLTWYEDLTTTIPLDPTTVLVDGEDYYVSARSNGCENSSRSVVITTLSSPEPITTVETERLFCGITSPTITQLEIEGIEPQNLIWYDSATEGNVLTVDTPLVDGESYYAVRYANNGCESVIRLQIDVTVISPPKPELIGSAAFCELENKNFLEFEEEALEELPTEYEYVWESVLEGDLVTEIDNLETIANIVAEDTEIFVYSIEPNSGCRSEPLLIEFDLSACNPEDYDFFIPDGFSPNGDGVNDVYYIPNIKFFYPEYQLEIFNRYGQSLFKGNIDNPVWDGTNHLGKKATTSGVYFFILTYNMGDLKPEQGRIYLSK